MNLPQISPQDKSAIQRIVTAGKRLMFDPKTFPMLKAGMTRNMPMPQKLATNAAGLMKILQDKAKGSIPRKFLIPAASMLMLEIGKFIEDAKLGNPTAEDMKAAFAVLVQTMRQVFPQGQQAPNGAPAAPTAPAVPNAAPAAPAQSGLIQGRQ